MAALSCPGKMAAAVSAVSGPEPLGEYVQVVVGEEGDPGQVMVVQEGAGGGITSDFLQSIAQTDTVFYVQPDGSLVPGGSLAEETVRTQVSLMTGGGLAEETGGGLGDQPGISMAEETEITQETRPLPPRQPPGSQGALKLSTPVLREASQQLRTVAHHVALIQGDSSSVTRLLSQKQLKSIRVQVPGLPSKNSTDALDDGIGENTSDLSNMNSANSSLLGAQIVQIKPLSDSAQQFLVSPSSLESPFQVLIRQAQLASAKAKTQDTNRNQRLFEPLDEERTCAAHPQNGSHSLCTAEKTQKKGQKRKKSVKIKTRSGRISRPPKHKAKDYKFLKVGDMIQGSSSDSEDYSELSTEEEEGGSKKESAPCHLQPYTVKNTLFQCQTCEKSYMGKGGLSRHYRLYPSHGQLESPFVSDGRKNGDAGVAGQSFPTEKKKPVPRPRKRLLDDPLNPTLARDGFEFVPLPTARRGRRQMSGRRFGRPRKILAAGPVEPTVKEMIEQCSYADLKGQVAPSFAKLFSVYDFLLIKVKQDHPDQPLFPHVYKEFENLHLMVKALAQEYVSNMALSTEKGTLDVTDSKVAESLGIPEDIINVCPVAPLVTEKQEKDSEAENECSGAETMPPSKRFRLDTSAEPRASEITPGVCEAELREEGHGSQGDNPEESSGNDPGSNAAEQNAEAIQPEQVDGDTESLQPPTQSEPVPCETKQRPLETSTLSTVQSCDDSYNILCELPEDTLSGFQTPATHEDVKEGTVVSELSSDLGKDESANPAPPSDCSASSFSSGHCPQMAEPEPMETLVKTFPTVEPSDSAEETYSETSHLPPEVGQSLVSPSATFCTENLGADECSAAYDLNHEHELVFIDSAEETITDEAVVIFDNTESTNTHLDTVVALVEM
ncbi:zinc finger protein 839 [Mixophyes fleayi]|uniref:zinc finger protein 839 n=1 Tax=Mixophyes fleayi TaxID=3061075 RepID=UPI003F4DBF0F